MAKSLIIGAMTNYNFDQVKPWVRSINQCGFNGDRVMIVFNGTMETCEKLTAEGFLVVLGGKRENDKVVHQSPLPIHVERFLHIYEYLRTNWRNYTYVITTDVKDVIFQSNPADWLNDHLGNKSMVAGSEALKYCDEPWGNENLLQAYGVYIHNLFKNNTIYNVGTLGGDSEWIKDLCLQILLNGVNRPIPIVDQAVFNVLIQTQPYKDVVYFAQQSDGWACQAGTTVDPSKIESFRPNLLEGEPQFKDGLVYTNDGSKKFCIVHQYDRVPEWKKVIEARYA